MNRGLLFYNASDGSLTFGDDNVVSPMPYTRSNTVGTNTAGGSAGQFLAKPIVLGDSNIVQTSKPSIVIGSNNSVIVRSFVDSRDLVQSAHLVVGSNHKIDYSQIASSPATAPSIIIAPSAPQTLVSSSPGATNQIVIDASVTPKTRTQGYCLDITYGAAWTSGAGANYVALGLPGTAPATSTIGIGHNHTASATSTISIGSSSSATASGCIAIGTSATAGNGTSGSNGIAIGLSANTVGGGGIAIGNSAVASNSTTYGIVIGRSASMSGVSSTNGSIIIGDSSSATGTLNSGIALGTSATVSGTNGIALGTSANCGFTYAVALQRGIPRTWGALACQPSLVAPMSATAGSSQWEIATLGASTTDATLTELVSTPSSRLQMPNNSCWFFNAYVVAHRSDVQGDNMAWRIEGTIFRGATAATAILIGTPTYNTFNSGTLGWTIAVTADTTNGALVFKGTGEAAKTIQWLARVDTVEMTA